MFWPWRDLDVTLWRYFGAAGSHLGDILTGEIDGGRGHAGGPVCDRISASPGADHF